MALISYFEGYNIYRGDKMTNKSNRIGKQFEEKLNKKFMEYRINKQAYISKVPTDWTVLRKGAEIVKAFPKGKSEFLDYAGTLKNGKAVFLEAKSCAKSPFPLSTIKPYQYVLIEEIMEYTDKVYLIIEMRDVDTTFLLKADEILTFEEKNKRKSIPLSWLLDNAIVLDNLNIIDYL